jgi:hypothetical protein
VVGRLPLAGPFRHAIPLCAKRPHSIPASTVVRTAVTVGAGSGWNSPTQQ